MRKMILVENKPWNTLENLRQLKKTGVEIEAVVYFAENSSAEKDSKLSTFIEESKLAVKTIRTIDFDYYMDKYTGKEDVFVLINVFLEKNPMSVGNRINIQYALGKEELIRKKICFYSTGERDIVSFLKEHFGKEQVIDVLDVDLKSDQIQWDNKRIIEIAQG